MALDGFVIASLVSELSHAILGMKISKIAQPESDELLFTLKGPGGQRRLAMSASASLPFVYLTDENKPSPLSAPSFCMLLRKHIANGRVASITQPGMERIIRFEIEHLDEMGDPGKKLLIVELMGKHSNIIFCDEGGRIIDSIKRVSSLVSSVREVLPGRSYEIPATQEDKKNPLEAGEGDFAAAMERPMPAARAIYGSFSGVSPLMANEICHRAHIDGDMPCQSLSPDEKNRLCRQFLAMMGDVRGERFSPNIVMRGSEPVEFSCFPLTVYEGEDARDEGACSILNLDSISEVLERYYASRNAYTRIRQKSSDLRRIVGTALDRSRKKLSLQEKQLRDTEKRDKYRLYGELLHAYGYNAPEGARELEAPGYDGVTVKIPLDPEKSAMENAKSYFDRYGKLKRTFEALTGLLEETRAQVAHLESIAASLDIAQSEGDLSQIREELAEYGYIRKRKSDKRKDSGKSRPLHYRSADGYDIYVGKNNYQNEELTFKFASGSDWWFHAKGIPGSHVVVRSEGGEMPDRVFEDAGRLAAYYSKGRESDKVEVDYLQRKNVKKPNGSAPGFVVYYTNYSLTISPDISGLTLVE